MADGTQTRTGPNVQKLEKLRELSERIHIDVTFESKSGEAIKYWISSHFAADWVYLQKPHHLCYLNSIGEAIEEIRNDIVDVKCITAIAARRVGSAKADKDLELLVREAVCEAIAVPVA